MIGGCGAVQPKILFGLAHANQWRDGNENKVITKNNYAGFVAQNPSPRARLPSPLLWMERSRLAVICELESTVIDAGRPTPSKSRRSASGSVIQPYTQIRLKRLRKAIHNKYIFNVFRPVQIVQRTENRRRRSVFFPCALPQMSPDLQL